MLPRPLGIACILALSFACAAHAGVRVTRTLPLDPGNPSSAGPIEVPAGQRLARVEVIALECAVDGVRAPASTQVRLGYQGFERGKRLAWLDLPNGTGLPPGHEQHAVQLQVRLEFDRSDAIPVARERVVPDWELSSGSLRARTASPFAPANPSSTRRADPYRPTQVPSLLGSPVAYLIVTSDELAPSFQKLADWKTASGVPAAVRTLSFIRAQYPAAVDDPERIRMFTRDAYTRWGTRWLLLGGDTEVIPPRIAHVQFLDDEWVPSDLYYSCLDGNWNADGDSLWAEVPDFASDGDDADLLPEVWVGRAPVVTPADADRFVRKTLTYETTPVADYMENTLLFAQVITPEHWTGGPIQLDGATIVEQDQMPFFDLTPNLHVARLYQNHTNPAWRPGALHETRAVVYDSLHVGYNLTMHVGHGYRDVMSCGDDNLTINDMQTLTNGDRLMNFYAIDCTSNAIDFASIGEALMRAPNGGAVTNIGSTRLDYPKFSRGFQKEYFKLLLRDSVTAVGEANGRQKLPFVSGSFFDGFARLSQLELLLLGDPELRIFTARPRELTVTAPTTIEAGAGQVAVQVAIGATPLLGARVTAWMPDHEYRTALTDGAGNALLAFHPDSVGACSLTVTAFNARPFRGSFTVVPGAPAALQSTSATVVDNNLAGRQGDGDALPDAGEHVDLVVPIRNAGGTTATTVTGTLSTIDPQVTITNPTADYGAIDPATTAAPASGFRIEIAPGCPDQHEVAFTLDLTADGGLAQQQHLRLLIRAAELVQVAHAESETGGNEDGRPQPGETVHYTFRIRNVGTGDAHALTGRLSSLDGLAVMTDSTFTLPDLAPGAEGDGTPVTFAPVSADARLSLTVDDANGTRISQSMDLGYPDVVGGITTAGGSGNVTLRWTDSATPDITGYNIYRGASASGPFTKVTPVPTGRVSSWTDGPLEPLTYFFYRVTAVDSSGNESSPSTSASGLTRPGVHAAFPELTRESSESPVAVAPGAGGTMDILVGGQVLHLFHSDGTWTVDADGSSATPGDFTTLGSYYRSGGSLGDLDGDGGHDVIGATWTSQQLLAFDEAGNLRSGFPITLPNPIWSSVAVGDLDGDHHAELVFGSTGSTLLAFHSNGTELRDGDNNPATIGVFKTLGDAFNIGTPALAPLLGPGQAAILYGSTDGFLYALKPDGTSLPGFPVNIGAAILGSVAVGKLDGASGPMSIVVPDNNGALHVRAVNGSERPGFPVFLPLNATGQGASPALADMNGDGFTDIVIASSNGRVYVFNRNGALVAPWSAASRFSPLTSEATRASAVVADIDGDGMSDVVVGDENGELAALSGATGAMLPGFPIQMAAEASGTAALCDCDGDGMSEIVTVDFGGTVHVWDYDFPFSPAGPPPWPQFHQNAQRTGTIETLDVTGVDPVTQLAPRTLELAAPRPNPARAGSPFSLAFGVPIEQSGAALELAVYDLAGRLVKVIASGPARAGRATASWDGRDALGARIHGGVYLARLRAGSVTRTRKLVVLP